MTGATAIPQVPPPPPLSRQSAVTHGQDQQLGDASGFSTLDRYPGVSGDRRLLYKEFTSSETHTQLPTQQLQGQVLGQSSQMSKPVLCQLSPQRAYATNLNLNQGLKQS